MKPRGHFFFIDDDEAEHVMFKKALRTLCDNEVISAYDGAEGYAALKRHKLDIFMIICDINMPKVNGLELKRMIETTPELKLRAIPFIFHTSQHNPIVVKEAFALGIQGFVKKSADVTQSLRQLELLVNFWSTSVHPNMLEPLK